MDNPKQEKKAKQACKFWMQGKCFYGQKCKNAHVMVKTTSSSQSTSNANNEGKKGASIYLEELANSKLSVCLKCKQVSFLAYLSCGCHDLCEACAKSSSVCPQAHKYDGIYIM